MDNRPTTDEIKKYYDDLYSKGQEKTMRPKEAYQIFIKLLKPQEGGKILDIACGAGNLLFSAHKKSLKLYGLDISIEALKVGKKTTPNANFTLGSGTNLPFKNNYFDYVTCLGSLEHFVDIDRGLLEMVRISKKSAKLCIVVPNIDYKFGAGTDQIEEKLLSLKEWKEFLQKNGLSILKIKQDKYFAKAISPKKILMQKSLKGKLRLFKKKILWTFMPLDKTYQFIFICEPS